MPARKSLASLRTNGTPCTGLRGKGTCAGVQCRGQSPSCLPPDTALRFAYRPRETISPCRAQVFPVLPVRQPLHSIRIGEIAAVEETQFKGQCGAARPRRRNDGPPYAVGAVPVPRLGIGIIARVAGRGDDCSAYACFGSTRASATIARRLPPADDTPWA